MLRRAAERLLGILYPEYCGLCGVRVEAGGRYFCSGCMAGMQEVGDRHCTVCGAPFMDGTGPGHMCAACMRERPAYKSARAPYVYGGAVRAAIHRFKYDHVRGMERFLAGLFAGHLSGWFGDVSVVVPVPLHPNRLRARGFNQSLLLARDAASELAVGLSVDGLARTRDTRPQVDLKPGERAANVKGAFEVVRPVDFSGRGVLLVDDVYTTGATVQECARVLRRAGAERVHVLTVARAL